MNDCAKASDWKPEWVASHVFERSDWRAHGIIYPACVYVEGPITQSMYISECLYTAFTGDHCFGAWG